MRIQGKEYRTIWYEEKVVKIIDQTKLPHQFIIKDLNSVKDAINAIKVMEVRGAPLNRRNCCLRDCISYSREY